MMIGTVKVDKIYIFNSEHHPDLVYVYFLEQGCIIDVKMTLKHIIEGML